MAIWIIIDICVFGLVVLLTGVLIPQILLISFRKNLLDAPDPRKIHHIAVPRLGGIAFFPTILFTVMLTIGVCRQFKPDAMDMVFGSSMTGMCFLACAVITLYLVGMADDLIGLKYRAKFVAQIVAAALVIIGGIEIENFHGFLGIQALPAPLAIIFTILLVVFITNAINLIDGIDGLASGLSAIAVGFFGYIFLTVGLHVYAMAAFATLGALVSFFYFNVFGNAEKHGKIFMGDTGALTIGLMLSVFSIRICNIPDVSMPVNSAVVAFAPLLIPCCDVVRVYIHRIKAHRSPFLPDKTHIHHKLLALGMTQRLAMPTIVAASLALTILNYYLSKYLDITILFILDIVIWLVANAALTRGIRRRSRALQQVLYD